MPDLEMLLFDFIPPISTPPNAIAFATCTIETREMDKAGSLVSLLGVIILLRLAVLLMNIEGLG